MRNVAAKTDIEQIAWLGGCALAMAEDRDFGNLAEAGYDRDNRMSRTLPKRYWPRTSGSYPWSIPASSLVVQTLPKRYPKVAPGAEIQPKLNEFSDPGHLPPTLAKFVKHWPVWGNRFPILGKMLVLAKIDQDVAHIGRCVSKTLPGSLSGTHGEKVFGTFRVT